MEGNSFMKKRLKRNLEGGMVMKSYSWDEIKDEIIEKLENPAKEDIARYIEKAYKMGYIKGINLGMELLIDLKYKVGASLKEYKESEGLNGD